MKNSKFIILLVVGAGLVLLAIMWAFNARLEIKRLQHNNAQLVSDNNAMATTLTLTDLEMKMYLEERIPAILDTLAALKLSLKNVNRVTVNKYYHKDTVIAHTDLQPVLKAIENKQEITAPWADSTACFTIKGDIVYRNGQLGLNVTDRTFQATTTELAYWQRKQWKFWFVRSRLFGKKEAFVRTGGPCGASNTITLISKKNGK